VCAVVEWRHDRSLSNFLTAQLRTTLYDFGVDARGVGRTRVHESSNSANYESCVSNVLDDADARFRRRR
jgi:hypothetical protein